MFYSQIGEFQATVAESALLGVHVEHFVRALTSVYNLTVWITEGILLL